MPVPLPLPPPSHHPRAPTCLSLQNSFSDCLTCYFASFIFTLFRAMVCTHVCTVFYGSKKWLGKTCTYIHTHLRAPERRRNYGLIERREPFVGSSHHSLLVPLQVYIHVALPSFRVIFGVLLTFPLELYLHQKHSPPFFFAAPPLCCTVVPAPVVLLSLFGSFAGTTHFAPLCVSMVFVT